ncbi:MULTISPECIES: DUF3624 domain-containing protein [Vibrio]|uniref:DUF3624 domain-containing protein n=1 Tax=Vibrio aestuarianus TaxID=28171 RepID=A0A7X6N3Z2_9VIBR|nr:MULTISPECIES: DUF3624 domain-containing protein [Vibrio]MDE1209298.1 DUF3624 domain-containing protein [Vibrio aestuarianus]MDE1212488.1 DUF3624 domain-containing protein [Vibrio aestuarianus]MDE1215770.1 DUF3624 domain-containing protein [Vibrio aestuarianus]MDE1220712.1 DUF3624 domain-containing protein [Vibrio aestuarianus]MDE1222971.1 DUF3624 domain-containing protein [Vibrio aestuarianus]
MSCNHCKQSWFWKKIGRCQRCMDQLTTLSVLCWVVWWWLCKDNPKSIESIALLMAGFTFNGLLFLHLWMKFVILPWRKRNGSQDNH